MDRENGPLDGRQSGREGGHRIGTDSGDSGAQWHGGYGRGCGGGGSLLGRHGDVNAKDPVSDNASSTSYEHEVSAVNCA